MENKNTDSRQELLSKIKDAEGCLAQMKLCLFNPQAVRFDKKIFLYHRKLAIKSLSMEEIKPLFKTITNEHR